MSVTSEMRPVRSIVHDLITGRATGNKEALQALQIELLLDIRSILIATMPTEKEQVQISALIDEAYCQLGKNSEDA
jgi:hypothetical protein